MKIALILILLIFLSFVDAAFKSELTELANNYPAIEIGKAKFFLPLKIEIKTLNTNENFFLILNKRGKLEIKDFEKADIILIGDEEDFKAMLNTQDINEISKIITEFQIQTKSFKGNALVSIIEKKLNLNLNVEKSFSYKLANFITGLFFI